MAKVTAPLQSHMHQNLCIERMYTFLRECPAENPTGVLLIRRMLRSGAMDAWRCRPSG